MSDLDSRYAKCERDIKQLRSELDALRSEMTEVVDRVLARVDEILTTVDTSSQQMFADLRAQTERDSQACGHASGHCSRLSATMMNPRN